MALIKSCLTTGAAPTTDSFSGTTASAMSTNATATITYTAPSGKIILGIDSLSVIGSNSSGKEQVAVKSAVNNGSSIEFTCVNYYQVTSQTATVSCNILLQ